MLGQDKNTNVTQTQISHFVYEVSALSVNDSEVSSKQSSSPHVMSESAGPEHSKRTISRAMLKNIFLCVKDNTFYLHQ